MIVQIKIAVRGVLGLLGNLFSRFINLDTEKSSVIGKSVEGRDIRMWRFGQGDKKILYFGGIHGNEVGTIKLMQRWVEYLQKNPPKNTQVFIIPCLNPDGFERGKKNPDYLRGGRVGKVNANGVDLNRNFPASTWSSEATIFVAGKSSPISGGDAPGSEPETQALLEVIKKENIQTLYVYHSCWATVMSSFTPEADKRTQRYADLSKYQVYTQDQWDSMYSDKKTGHGTVWAIENTIDFIEIELKTRWWSEWKRNKPALIDSLGENL